MPRMLCLICASTSAAGIDRQNGRAEPREEAVDELHEHRALVGEVEIESALRDARPRDDVVDFRRVIALRREYVARRVKQLEPALRLAHGHAHGRPCTTYAPIHGNCS